MSLAASKDTQLKRARLYPDIIHLHLDEAKLCANCDTIHTGSSCPTCASANCLLLSSVIGRMSQNLNWKKAAASANSAIKNRGYYSDESESSSESKKGAFGVLQFLHLISGLK